MVHRDKQNMSFASDNNFKVLYPNFWIYEAGQSPAPLVLWNVPLFYWHPSLCSLPHLISRIWTDCFIKLQFTLYLITKNKDVYYEGWASTSHISENTKTTQHSENCELQLSKSSDPPLELSSDATVPSCVLQAEGSCFSIADSSSS